MWSRKGSPLATWMRPRPPIRTVAVSRVSLLLRVTRPCLLTPNLHGVGVRVEALERGERYRGVAPGAQLMWAKTQDARPLQEGVHSQRRAKSGGARGRKRVIGAGDVIAERHGGVRPDED